MSDRIPTGHEGATFIREWCEAEARAVACQAERIRDLVSENNKLANQLRAALTQLAAKPVVHQPEAMASLKQRALEEEYKLALELIKHCWLHNNYRWCGYWQMTTEEKDLFRVVTKLSEETIHADGKEVAP